MARYVALLRGINVGRAKRVPMADLRAAVEGLGASDVKTLLNSGNVVFTASRKPSASAIEAAVLERTGVSSKVTVLMGDELKRAVRDCPLLDVADDHSRLALAVLASRADADKIRVLTERDWTPEVLAVGTRVAYVWCPDGFAGSGVSEAIHELVGDRVTTRNWSTIGKVAAAL